MSHHHQSAGQRLNNQGLSLSRACDPATEQRCKGFASLFSSVLCRARHAAYKQPKNRLQVGKQALTSIDNAISFTKRLAHRIPRLWRGSATRLGMKALHLTTWLLLLAMLTLFSGAASFVHVHEHASHTDAATPGHEHCSHGVPSDSPDQPQPSDHEDCATCFVLLHLTASTLDLVPTADLPSPRCADALLAPETIFALSTTRVPSGRGPPTSNPL